MANGAYEHNFDGKNRVFVPAKFRDEFGEDFIYKLCPSKFPSIQLFSRADYERLYPKTDIDTTDEIRDRKQRARRNLGTGEASCDSQGRIILNPLITKIAKLQKQCVFVGFETYVEIMSPETYEAYLLSLYEDYLSEEESYEQEEKVKRKLRSEGAFLKVQEPSKEADEQ